MFHELSFGQINMLLIMASIVIASITLWGLHAISKRIARWRYNQMLIIK